MVLTAGTRSSLRIFLAALQLFYQVMCQCGDYAFPNPLIDSMSATIAAVESHLEEQESELAFPRMPDESGVVEKHRRPVGRLSDNYYNLEHKAERGELRQGLPVGLARGPVGEVITRDRAPCRERQRGDTTCLRRDSGHTEHRSRVASVFPLVGGLVLETGGLLSYGAIIAREYGVPAVINVPGVLSIIKDGQTIEVDGTNGRVYLDLNNADGGLR